MTKISLKLNELLDAFRKLLPVLNDMTSKNAVNGVFLDTRQGRATLCATNAYMLVEIALPPAEIEGDDGEAAVVWHADSVRRFVQTYATSENPEQKIAIEIGRENRIGVVKSAIRMGCVYFCMEFKSAEFYPYHAFFDKKSALIAKGVDAAKYAEIFYKAGDNIVDIRAVGVKSSQSEEGDGEFEADEAFNGGLQARFAATILRSFGKAAVDVFALEGDTPPYILKSDDAPGVRCAIMPLYAPP